MMLPTHTEKKRKRQKGLSLAHNEVVGPRDPVDDLL